MGELYIRPKTIVPGERERSDVIDAISDQRISRTHCYHQCFKKTAGRNRRLLHMDADGLLPDFDVAEDYLLNTKEFLFERLSQNEARLVRLADMNEIRFQSNQPFTQHDGNLVYMDIDLTVYYYRQAPQFPIFGTVGRERWYGGNDRPEETKIDLVWNAVAVKTGKVKTDLEFRFWSAGTEDLKHFLLLRYEQFNDFEADSLAEYRYQTHNNGEFKWNGRDHVTREWKSVFSVEYPEDDTAKLWNKELTPNKHRFNENDIDALMAKHGLSKAQVEDPNATIEVRKTMIPEPHADVHFDRVRNEVRDNVPGRQRLIRVR